MKNMGWKQLWLCLILILLSNISAEQALAHRDDYLDETVVFLTLGQDELEVEYWFDYGWDQMESNHFFRHHAAVEWGITEYWMVDGRLTVKDVLHEGTEFDGGRLETRYRFGEENEYPVDFAVSAEFNWERNDRGTIVEGLEPRIIFSKDFHDKLNLTLNLSEEFPFDSGSPAFLISGGMRYNWTGLVRIGLEWHHDTGEVSGSIIPQVWFTPRQDVTVKLGYSAGYENNEEDFVRLALEVEF